MPEAFREDDLLATSNCETGSVSLYRHEGTSLTHVQDIVIPEERAFSHGVKFMPSPHRVFCTTTPNRARFSYFLSTDSGEPLYKFGDADWKVKDCCFIDTNRMAVLYASSTVSATAYDTPVSSKLALVSLDLPARKHTVAHEVTFGGHSDSCVYHDGMVFVTNGTHDCVMLFRVESNSLRHEGNLGGYLVPHGIDVRAGLLAITSYGSNTVTVSRL